MRVSWRGLLALSPPAGFFVLAVGIVLGLAGVTVWLFADHHGSAAIKVALAAGFMVAAAVAAVRTALAARPAPRGAPLTRADQPELWREIDELAVLAGTRTPDDVRLTPDVNPGVREEPNLLGLRAGPRHLEIGLPLLAGTDIRLSGRPTGSGSCRERSGWPPRRSSAGRSAAADRLAAGDGPGRRARAGPAQQRADPGGGGAGPGVHGAARADRIAHGQVRGGGVGVSV
jgi:hypothetical protein